MSPTPEIPPRIAVAITLGTLPLVLLPLVRRRIITQQHLNDRLALYSVVRKHLREAVKNLEWCAAIDESFLEESNRLWRHGDRFVAVVLYATAVEQYLNSMYQHILPRQGWTSNQITCLLREVAVDSKITWMFEVFAKERFPTALGKRLRNVFGIRNAIVHFKGELGPLDSEQDSHSKVEAQLRSLRRMSFSRDFRSLNKVFSEALFRQDPDRHIVMRACQLLLKGQ